MFGDAASSDSHGEGSGSDQTIPKWKFYTNAFYSAEPAVGLYRRVGDQWDLGLQLSGSFATSDDDEKAYDRTIEDSVTDRLDIADSEHSRDRFSGAVTTELRRWNQRSKKLSLFYGLRVRFWHIRDEVESIYTRERERVTYDEEWQTEYKDEDSGRGFGVWPVTGVDVRLLDHVSAAVVLTPIGVGLNWWDRSYYRIEHYLNRSERTDLRDSRDDESETAFSWNLVPKLYLSIDF
jgi:hypothetical protein